MSNLNSSIEILHRKTEELREAVKQMKIAVDDQWSAEFRECFAGEKYDRLCKKIEDALNSVGNAETELDRYRETDGLRPDFERLVELRSILMSKEYHLLQLLGSIGECMDALPDRLFGGSVHSIEREYLRLKGQLSVQATDRDAFERSAGLKMRSKRVAEDFSVGKIVTMGNYGGEAVEWLVLAAEGDTRTMITVKGQDAVCFNKSYYDGNQWENSYIRRWLNVTYFNTAFSADEQAMITAGPTGDKVWLLSVDEAIKYFANDDARVCYPTDHAKKNGAFTYSNGACLWWLRSPGSYSYRAALVCSSGFVDSDGYDVGGDSGLARPVVVVALGF